MKGRFGTLGRPMFVEPEPMTEPPPATPEPFPLTLLEPLTPEPLTDPLPLLEVLTPRPLVIGLVTPPFADPLPLLETLTPPVPIPTEPPLLPFPLAEPFRPRPEPEPVTPVPTFPPPVSDCAPAVRVVAATRLTPMAMLDNHFRMIYSIANLASRERLGMRIRERAAGLAPMSRPRAYLAGRRRGGQIYAGRYLAGPSTQEAKRRQSSASEQKHPEG
jgi:hypothetical protein